MTDKFVQVLTEGLKDTFSEKMCFSPQRHLKRNSKAKEFGTCQHWTKDRNSEYANPQSA